jgi:hypothetical protein
MKDSDAAAERVPRSRKPIRQLSPQRFLNSILFCSFDDPWKTVRLERDVVTDYCLRSLSLKLSLAELYHENSKLWPQVMTERPTLEVPFGVFREQYIRRRGAVLETMQFSSLDLPSLYHRAVSIGGQAVDRDVWYAVELRTVFKGLLADYDPLSETFRVVKELTANELDRLQAGLNSAEQVAVEDSRDSLLLLVIGSFARNEVLYGIRGYRRTLIEAGRLIESLLEHAQGVGLVGKVLYDFMDREVDAAIDADGTEQGTLAAVILRPMTGGV